MEKWKLRAIGKILAEPTGQHLIKTDGNSSAILKRLYMRLRDACVLLHEGSQEEFPNYAHTYTRIEELMASANPQDELIVLIDRIDLFEVTFTFREWLQRVENYGGLVVATCATRFTPERDAFESIYYK